MAALVLRRLNRTMHLIYIVLLAAPLILAQMRGGNSSGMGHDNSGMMPGHSGQTPGNEYGRGMHDALEMMGEMGARQMMDGPAIGPDGTAFILRRVAPGSNPNSGMMQPPAITVKHEVVAISARDGSTKWRLELTGEMVSGPAPAKDGKIFFTAFDYPMAGLNQPGGGMMGANAAAKARLIVVTADLASARVSNTVEVESEVLTAPRVASDESGNYVVYVTGFEMPGADRPFRGNDRFLYAFNPDGRLRFKVRISQEQAGMMFR